MDLYNKIIAGHKNPRFYVCLLDLVNMLILISLVQSLQYSPGSKFNYSDLSMITLMYVVGTVARSANAQVSY